MTRKIKLQNNSHSLQQRVVTVKQEVHSDQMNMVSTQDIEYSPFNYRKTFREDDLKVLGNDILIHGMISPLTVRPMTKNKYQLVAGERRLRASRLVGVETVPVVIKELTDGQVIEIQLAENIQRENPHPMEEASAIGQMLNLHKTIEEIALRLGKSKQFVYARIKLLSLITLFQEMFIADVLTIQQAVNIASLEELAQNDLYDTCCTGWQQKKNFQLNNLDYYLNQFKYDLKSAPFNTKDKKLLPEVGACTGCSFNSATLKSLFPEYAKQAVCNNQSCYRNKCLAHLVLGMTDAFAEHQPEALLLYGEPTEQLENILQSISAAAALPRYEMNAVERIDIPEQPEPDEYTYDEELDEEEYNTAMEDYQTELEQYHSHVQSGKYKKGLLISLKSFQLQWFTLERVNRNGASSPRVTAKEVQQAIKEGTATPELFQAEIDRIEEREKRSQEIDRDKIQLAIHEQFTDTLGKGCENIELTAADQLAARLIIYQALDYSSRQIVQDVLFSDNELDEDTEIDLIKQLKCLTDQQFSYLIRMVLTGKSDSKYPRQDAAKVLCTVAESAGINIAAIEREFEQKAADRQIKKEQKINVLEKKITLLTATK